MATSSVATSSGEALEDERVRLLSEDSPDAAGDGDESHESISTVQGSRGLAHLDETSDGERTDSVDVNTREWPPERRAKDMLSQSDLDQDDESAQHSHFEELPSMGRHSFADSSCQWSKFF